MKRKSTAINILLILILILLLGWGGISWLQPKYPLTVNGDGIVPASRELKIPTLSRQIYSNATVGDVTRLNLFRKQRRKYFRPKPPKPKPQIRSARPKVAVAPPPPPPPPKPTAPPPQLVLTGVMLFNDHKVAIFEGTYSEIRGGRLVQNLKPRRRGYKIGEALGDYRIKAIDKSHATLSAITGNNLTLTISKTPQTQKIQKTGNNLVQRGKPGLNNIPITPSTRQTRRPQPNSIRKNLLNKIPPSLNLPFAVPTPGSKTSQSGSKRLPRSRQKSTGF